MTEQRVLPLPKIASAIRSGLSPFLRINSTIQSYLQIERRLLFGRLTRSRRQQGRWLAIYGALVFASLTAAGSDLFGDSAKAMLLGVGLPGAGFLYWASGDQAMFAIAALVAAMLGFGIALVIWFATGNVLAPLCYWMTTIWLASRPELAGLEPALVGSVWPFALAPAVWAALAVAWFRPTESPPTKLATRNWTAPREVPEELSLEDLQRQRLLLDRALQGVDHFNGFEKRDQFQTAALRYQVNFTGYALAMSHRRFTPASEGYLAEAQQHLLTKIGDRRLWRYWQLENAWGNLRIDADPVAHQNIMYSGFTALQMALSGTNADLVLHKRGTEWQRYSLVAITELLAQQYRTAPYGLLACEPGWIYPLCNLITAAGLKAADTIDGTNHWQELSGPFLASLTREGTRPDGSFIAFRSSLTGIAPPAPGGIVMQAFPCLFLNCLDPELAQHHWQRVRAELASHDWQRLFWPVDVGNYGFSRASSYAATAAAAVEMGDDEIATECLERLEAECSSRIEGGVIHRQHASLWANALEMAARCGKQDGLRDHTSTRQHGSGPQLIKADYPEVLIARAQRQGGVLHLVLYPGGTDSLQLIELGGLMPERHYHTGNSDQPFLRADSRGRALIKIPLHDRTALSIKPVV